MSDDPLTIFATLLEKQVSTLEANLNLRLDMTERSVTSRFDQQDKELAAIREQTTKTNGRVTVLERARDRSAGIVAAYSWLPPIIAAIIGAGLAALITTTVGG